MRILSRLCILFLLFLWGQTAFASQTEAFTAGKEYQVITASIPATLTANPKPGKIQVLEFFSYGCPACNRLEPYLEKWLHNISDVSFERVPVIFENGWQTYAKAYYTAQALGINNKITPALFDAIHKQGLDLSSSASMQQFFQQQGINQKDFESAFNYSPTITWEVKQGNTLMQAYQVLEIPTFVIAGKYKTNIAMVNGNDAELMKVVSFLVKKAS